MPWINYTFPFNYRPLPGLKELPGFPNFFPAIAVRLANTVEGSKKVDCIAVIDSGAYISVFDGEYASQLGLTLQDGRFTRLSTAGSCLLPAYIHEVEILLGEPTQVRNLTAEVAFAEGRLLRNLLGRRGFFENFQVGFNEHHGEVYLEPYSSSSLVDVDYILTS